MEFKTKRLYKEDVYLKETTAVLRSFEKNELGDTITVCLDKTIFFPTGGGQSCDKGTINGLEVIDVYEKDWDIFHVIKVDASLDINNMIKNGDTVSLELDWQHRFDNMQRHLGEHILTGVFHDLYGGINRGFHMGDQYMTIDISFKDNPDYSTLTFDMAKEAELNANMIIWENTPVTSRYYKTKAEASGLPLRKPLAIDEDITIVSVGSLDNPANSVACCGTHPSNAGQVGLIKVYKVESNKGMFRVYFDAGQRAFTKYQKEFDTLTAISNNLSSGIEDVMDKFKTQNEKNKQVRTQLHLLTKEVIKKESERIIHSLNQGDTSSSYDILSLDDLMAIAKEISPFIKKVYFLIHKPSSTVLLVSDGSIDCGKLVKENASIYNGKGGGNKTMARAIFTKDEYVDTFIDLIEKHLR